MGNRPYQYSVYGNKRRRLEPVGQQQMILSSIDDHDAEDGENNNVGFFGWFNFFDSFEISISEKNCFESFHFFF